MDAQRPRRPTVAEGHRREHRSALAIVLVAVSFALAGTARAAGPIGGNGDAITTSDYAIDMFQGPVFAGTRVTGLAGAYVAIAEDVDGDLQTPAAPAVRPFYSLDYFDYGLGFGLTFPGALKNMDFFNSGAKTEIFNAPDSFVFFTPALNLQWGRFGVGGTVEAQSYSFGGATTTGATQSEGDLKTYIWTTHLQAANAFFDGQLAVGLGARLLALSVNSRRANDQAVFTTAGAGIEIGALWRPNDERYRLGATFRTAIDTRASYSDDLLPNADGDLVIDQTGTPFYLPKRVTLPWDVNVGASVQLGPRPFNPEWRTPDDLAERTILRIRLRALDRRDERDRRLADAVTASERDAIEAEFSASEEADERELEQARRQARRELEQRLAEMPRFYVLLSGSVLISGAVDDAVGVESFLAQEVNRSGRRIVVSPRLGAETEVWPDVLKVRGGSYLEPTRFATSSARVHGTAGFDVRLVQWSVFGLFPDDYVWRFGGAADVAARYFTWGVTLGGWYPRHSGTVDHGHEARRARNGG